MRDRISWLGLRCGVAATLAAAAFAQAPALLQVDGALYGFDAYAPDGSIGASGSGRSVVQDLPAGAWQLRFGPGGGGRALPLIIDASPGSVIIAASARPPEPAAEPDLLAASVTGTRIFGAGDDDADVRRDLRVRARLRPEADASTVGLVCRWSGADDHYRLVWDCSTGELRVERRLGGSLIELARAPAPEADGTWHSLELQVEGFRLQAFCDDRPVALLMDGALSDGGYGTYSDSDSTEFVDVTAAEPALAIASIAARTVDGQTDVVARAPVTPFSVFAVVLRMDRPTAVWPTDENGFEPALLTRLAEPLIFLRGTVGEVANSGAIRASFAWPRLPALSGQAVLIGALIGTPDGRRLQSRLPWAAVRF